jgi:Golgi nucleoside diphosphatase
MQNIKLVSITSILVFIAFSTMLLIGCAKDRDLIINGTNIQPCKNTVCYNGGSCIDGICYCPIGFEGNDCNLRWNERYVGNYTANDGCDAGNSYNVNISQIINRGDAILVNNISKLGTNVNLEGMLNPDKTTVNFTPQRFNDSIYISGTGTQTEAKDFINIWLTARDTNNHVSKNCSIVLRKL